MAIEVINLGSGPGAGNGDPLRVAFEKINNNFATIGSPIKIFVDVFTPTTSQEYPTSTPVIGQTWLINNVAVGGYTFVTGDLVGEITYNGNELFYNGVEWVILTVGENSNAYLLIDGTVPMDPTYVPTLANDVVVKSVTDLLQTAIDNNTTGISLVNTELLNKANVIHTHVKTDIVDADWISSLMEDLTPQLGNNLNTFGNKIFNSFQGDTGNGTYGVDVQNNIGDTSLILDNITNDTLSLNISSTGESEILSSRGLVLDSTEDLVLKCSPSTANIILEADTDSSVIIKSRANSVGNGHVIINDIRMPVTLPTGEGQVMVSGATNLDELTWEDLVKSGDTISRPSIPETGTQYFDTDLGIPIWYNGTDWVDATGTVASGVQP